MSNLSDSETFWWAVQPGPRPGTFERVADSRGTRASGPLRLSVVGGPLIVSQFVSGVYPPRLSRGAYYQSIGMGGGNFLVFVRRRRPSLTLAGSRRFMYLRVRACVRV